MLMSFTSRPKPLSLGQPLPCLSGFGMIEVLDRRFCERLAERRHALLPLLFPDHRELLDVGEVFNGELRVLPQRAGIPALKTGHIEQYSQLSVLLNESLERLNTSTAGLRVLWNALGPLRHYIQIVRGLTTK